MSAKGLKPEEPSSSDSPGPPAATAPVKAESSAKGSSRLSRQGSASTSGAVASDSALARAAAKPAEGKGGAERKGFTMKERLKICQQTERRRITFGKVLPSFCAKPQPVSSLTLCQTWLHCKAGAALLS